MAHECEDCGETFATVSRLRLHDCPAESSGNRTQPGSFEEFLDSVADGMDATRKRNFQERKRLGREAASEPLQTTLDAAAQGDVAAGFETVAHYERNLREYHEAEDYDTYRGILWAFYEPIAGALDTLARREGWGFIAALLDAYPPEGTGDEPLASPVVQNAVGRHIIRTRLTAGVEAVPVDALTYLASFWEAMGTVNAEESFPYGWGIGHPDHSVSDHLTDVVREELFWVRGVLAHTFYADQYVAADILDGFIAADHIEYEDRYLLVSVLSTLEPDTGTQVPRYWDWQAELDYRFEWDDPVRERVREAIEREGFHERLPDDWTFGDMNV